MSRLTSELILKLVDDVSGPASKVAKALRATEAQTKAVKKALAGSGASDRTVRDLAKLGASAKQVDAVSVALRNYGKSMGLAGDASKWTAVQRAQYKAFETSTVRSIRAVQKAHAALAATQLESAVKAAEATRRQIAAQRAQAAAAALARKEGRRTAAGTLASGVGVTAAYRGKQLARNAIESAGSFDIGVRRQRFYAGISEDRQQELIAQAKRIGQETPFTNLDVVEAQTTVMQRIPEQLNRAKIALAVSEEVKNYALSMRADMKASAEGITAFLQQSGKDITTQESAIKESRRAANLLVRMAKLGGLSDEDVQGYMRYAAPTGTLAGLTDTTLGALGVGLKRAGFRGDEAGTAIRSISSKLVAPGRKGMDALSAMGVDYNRFTTMPGGMSVQAIESMQKRRFGKTFSKSQRIRLDEVLSDGDIINDKDEFVSQVSAIIAESFGKKKNGETKAQDSQKIAKLASDFHQLSIQSINAEGLLAAILQAQPSLQQLNDLFNHKQGGKAGALGKVFEQVLADKAALSSTPDDFSKKIADGIMGGLGGSIENVKGSWETFVLNLGTANSGLIRFAADGIGKALDGFSNLNPSLIQAGTAFAAIAAVGGGAVGAFNLTKMLLGLGGSHVALSGSAAALTGSAEALTAAAIRLGGGGPGMPNGGPASKVPGGAAATGGIVSRLVPQFARAGGVLAPIMIFREIGEAHRPMTPEGAPYRLDQAISPEQWEKARRAQDEMRIDPEGARARANQANLRALEGQVKAELTGSAEVTGHTTTTIKVEAGSSLISIVDSVKTLQTELRGQLNATGGASSGVVRREMDAIHADSP